MQDTKALDSQINVLTARFNQIETNVEYTQDKKEMLQAPIARQLEKVKAERGTIIASECETNYEEIIPTGNGLN